MSEQLMNFSQALELLKNGEVVTRVGWNNPTIKVRLQRPDANSEITIPYLYMEKGTPGEDFSRFPLDLSCESIMAEDWALVRMGK